ncbi:hypothetical protein An03g00930 [Aspergillus niger]|uniref:Uncharacterized protein n=2 Tax=Aspergillus niger TaxID=5061 RepID=A2QFV6_ASPNC|nr:hypothetical protein An03g00930 [Aspergillus niger]CAK38066.1 hypothetical protein An03g00930 [Aspergillus niger]
MDESHTGDAFGVLGSSIGIGSGKIIVWSIETYIVKVEGRLEQKESLKPVDGVSVPHYQDGRETTSVDPGEALDTFKAKVDKWKDTTAT